MRPKLMQLAGEKADGWLGYLATPKFLDEVVRPELSAGAQRAGRDVAEVEIATEVICCVSPDREEAYRRARIHVGFYVAHPVSDVVVEVHGLQEEVGAVRQALMTNGLAGLDETDEKLVETFSIAGTPEEARQKLGAWEDALPHLVLHTPYVPPLSAEESEDAYRNIVDAFGDVATARRDGAEESVGAAVM
jgi:alkanesulfonate monooxygenase SsuD/methylene tetrahydromethanopterin reductase-like flavin-dependent oxidoreductase (luciferase family)